MKYHFLYESAIGPLILHEQDGLLTGISFLTGAGITPFSTQKKTRLFVKVCKELDEYFAGNRKEFDLPLAPHGTPFQKKVWKALMDIPYGETRSYKQIAECLGNPKAYRAVGMANNRNPLPFIIPCHRVVGNDGTLIGYAGGIDIKKRLIELESKNI